MRHFQMGSRIVLVAVMIAGCGGGGSGADRDGGSDRVDQTAATGGTNGSSGGSGGSGGRGLGGEAATGGVAGRGGTAGTNSTSASGGAGGQGGVGGRDTSGGQGGVVGQGGGAGGRGGTGLGGAAGAGARGGAGTGGVGGSAGAAGDGGHAGAGGRAGAGGGAGQGIGGAGGRAGQGGGGAGQGGTAGTSTLRVTRADPHPANQAAILGMLVAVDSQDTAVVIGPATSSGLQPAISWLPRQGATRRLVFANAATPRAMAIGPADALWLVGYLFGPVSFGGPTLPAVENGYYLCRLGADGSHQQSVSVPTTGSPELRAVTTDAGGNVYVVGALYFFGPATTTKAFVTKFSPTGQVIWNREFASTGSSAYVGGVVVTPGGEVAIAGAFSEQLALGTPPLVSQSTMSGGYNGFWATLDSNNGNLLAVFRFGGTIFDLANTIDVTSAGALRIAGQLSGTSTVGGIAVTAASGGSPFVAEVSTGGAARWVRVISGRGIVFGSGTNAADRTFAAGRIDGTTSDSFLASVGGDAALTIPLRTTTGEANGAVAAAADRHGGAWVAGEFLGSANFGTGPIVGSDPTQPTNYLVHLEP